jgi:hypothetical protein
LAKPLESLPVDCPTDGLMTDGLMTSLNLNLNLKKRRPERTPAFAIFHTSQYYRSKESNSISNVLKSVSEEMFDGNNFGQN